MGGPCDAALTGDSPEEIMQKGGEHVNEMAAQGDQGHIDAKKMMDDAVNDPAALQKWQSAFMETYNAASEE
jgi:hypothetical protein